MTKEEAIKYLQQLYPNGGHCWLDEQRIEAISMAVSALEHEKPVSEDLKEEIRKYLLAYKGYPHVMDDTERGIKDAAIYFANWQQERDEADRVAVYKCGWNDRKAIMMKKSFDAKILPANIEETEFCLDEYEEVAIITEMVNKGEFKMGDKVKVIILKDS